MAEFPSMSRKMERGAYIRAWHCAGDRHYECHMLPSGLDDGGAILWNSVISLSCPRYPTPSVAQRNKTRQNSFKSPLRVDRDSFHLFLVANATRNPAIKLEPLAGLGFVARSWYIDLLPNPKVMRDKNVFQSKTYTCLTTTRSVIRCQSYLITTCQVSVHLLM